MERQEIIDKLLSAARQSDDSALVIEAGVAVSLPLFEAADHDRRMELYAHAIQFPREAKRLRDEANTFRAAAALLGQHP